MHTLKLLSKPNHLLKINAGMGEHSEFIVTNVNYHQRCDLGQCVIGTRPPYFVARLRVFKTGVKNVALAERNERERTEWLLQRVKAEEWAREAELQGKTVREFCGDHYDEELDEPRLVAKVPGLNAYLELLGTMGPEDTEGEQFWQQERTDAEGNAIRQPFDRMIDAAAATAMNRMAYHVRAVMKREDQRDCASAMGDWQPREDWHEDYDAAEYFQRPEQRGIGFDHVDATRRPTPHPKHQLTEQEKQEYARLKQEAIDAGRTLNADLLAQLAQQACENVAVLRMVKQD